MKFKKEMMILSLGIVMIFAVSSVCAVDSEIQAVGSFNSTGTAVGTANDDSLNMYDANEMLAETDDLNNTVNGNSSQTYIELDKDYHGKYNDGNGIEIKRNNVVIDGKGHTIDCTGENSRMFYIVANNITLKNIRFTGGYSECGGAIYTNGYLKIINCTFEDNQATGDGNDNLGGGAIYANDVKMSIYNCTFINNRAAKNGGAIAAVGEDSNDYEIFNCTFISNSAGDSGGAFYSYADMSMGNIINSTFINNRAKAGDAIYARADEGNIDRCFFINNTANSMIDAQFATLTVNNSIIVNNYGDTLVQAYTWVIDNNWWGTTADNLEAPVVSGDTLENYYVLNMTADDDSADITLDNLCGNNGVITTSYNNYALPSIIFKVKATNIEVKDTVVLGADGKATIEHAPSAVYEITIEYNGVELTRDVKPSFKWLNNKINDDVSEVSLEQDCTYDSTKDYILTNGIEFAKDMTIDGQGHMIDANNLSNIFYFNDTTASFNLTLKNIVFANAKGVNGSAVYFKGNKLEIINCTFINNTADLEGDAVYVANALSNANIITGSLFTENTGNNSLIYINLDSNANLKVDNSIFIKNSAANNIKATGNVIAQYNWMGNTFENKENAPETEGVNVTNWLFVKIDADAAMNGDATVSLNNVYDHGEISKYGEYALKHITFTIGGLNATVPVPEITLGDDGQASYQFRMDRSVATLTASCDNVTTSAQLQYVVKDDGSFRALNEILFFSEDGDVIELTHDYEYLYNDTITEGIVIPRKVTINGNGHTIDAKGKTRIFMVPEGVSDITINNISFTNAKASYGSVFVISHNSNNLNISNCNFTDNNATDYGGVIDCVGDFCTIENCNFINNRAVSKAGVIRYYHDTQAYIKNSNFINNRVADGSSGGGAIYVDDGAVDIDKSVFINNVANDKPGSVLYTLKSAAITNSVFLNNPGADVIHGGSGVKLTNNWFGNTSSDYNSFAGGNETVSGVYKEATLNNWLYLDIIFFEDYAIISLDNAYDKLSGSAWVISNYNLPEITLNITSTTLGLNTDKVTLDGKGQARVNYTKGPGDDKLTVSNEYVSLTKDVIVDDFYNLQWLISENDEIELDHDYVCNVSDSITEGIAIRKNVIIDGKGHTIDARQMTRIFNVQALNVTLKNIIFANGKSNSSDGGAIYCNVDNGTGMYFNIVNCTFTNNDGALYIETNNSKITIDGCLFTDNGNAIVWNSTNDNASTVKNSIFLDNGLQGDNAEYTFLLISGNVNIDGNWWGTTAQNITFNTSYTRGITPSSWLFINSSVSPDGISYNQTATVKYILQSYNGTDFDSSRLPYVAFDVSCDIGELDKSKVAINEEFTYRASDAGNAAVTIHFNAAVYETLLHGPYMIPKGNEEFIIYANQSLGRDVFIKTADGNYTNLTVTCNDSSLITFDDDGNVRGKGAEGTARLTFSYDGSSLDYPYADEINVTVRLFKVPLNITVTNLESDKITLNVTDVLDLNIAFEIDEIHKGYASPWGTAGSDYDSNIISFAYDNTGRAENGSYYPIGRITAKAGGATNLTIYSTSDIFAFESCTISIVTNKIPTSIEVDGNDSFKVDDIGNFNAVLLANGTQAPAELTYNSSDEDVIRFTFEIGDFEAVANGTAVVTVRFEGNETHESSSKAVTLTVTKYDTATTVTSDKNISLHIDEKSCISANLTSEDSSFAGNLSYSSSNESVATVENGVITAIANGTATITVRYCGDRKYEASQDVISLTVFKNATQITADDMVLNSTDAGIEIGATVNVTGEYVLHYSSDNESVVTVSSDGRLTAVGGGQAQVTITYYGAEKYLSSTKTITVTVKKLQTRITVGENPVSTIYNETVVIAPKVIDANGTEIGEGTVSLYIGDKAISKNFTVDRVGEFIVTVKYAENTKYLASELNVTVISAKADNHIAVSVDDAVYHDAVTVRITANQDDNYTVDINGTPVKVEVTGGKGSNTIALPAGSYYANVTGYSSPLFKGITLNDTFTVVKAESSINIIVLNGVIHVGEAIMLNATVPDDATGNVTFTLNGDKTVNIGETATFEGLDAGNYTVYAVYNGDSNYRASGKANATINVIKYDLNLNVFADDITYGESLVVQLKTNATFTGSVLVNVGRVNQTVSINNGLGNATFVNLAAGEYVATAIFDENGKFYAETANATLTVAKADSTLNIIVLNDVIHVGEAISVNATVPGDATGNVTFTLIGDKTVNVGETAILEGLGAGNYTIYAVYNGDNNYRASGKANATIKVIKYDFNLNVTADDIAYGENLFVKVNTNGLFTGNITVTAGELSATAHIVNGNGNATFADLAKGEYTIAVNFTGDDSFNADAKTADVNVNGFETPLVISYSAPVVINEDVVVTVAMANDLTGNVTVIINNRSSVREVVSGRLQFNVSATAGEHNITVSFKGNDKYYAAENGTSFTVDKLDLDLAISADSVSYGEDLVVNVKTNDKFTGDLTVIVGELGGTAYIVDGVGNVSFAGLARGEYAIAVNFTGDYTFNADSKNATVTVKGFETPLVISYSTPVVINEDVVVTVIMADDLTDSVTVIINNSSFVKEVVSGRLQFNITAVYGEDNITVSFKGNDKYYDAENSTSFIVNKLDINLDVSVDSVSYGENLVVNVKTNEKFTGDITVNVGELSGTAYIVDGVGNVSFAGLARGEYVISANFTGDDTFNADFKNATVNVKGFETPLVISYSTLVVINENVIITVIMDDGFTDNVTVTINNISSVKEVIAGKLQFNITAVYGKDNITVSFKGNDKYYAAENSTSFTVNKLDLDLVISAGSVSYGEDLVVNVNTNDKFTGEITVIVGELSGTAYIVDGVGNVSFAGLARGEYVISVNFTGDDTFNADFKNATVTVKGFETPLIVSYSTPVVINENVTVTVIMDGNLTDSVTVTINNSSFVKDVVAGRLEFNIAATAGEHNIAVSFKGNDKYYAARNSTSFTVNKLDMDLDISADSIMYGEDLVVNVNTNDKFTGDITVIVGELSGAAHIINGVGNVSFAGLARGEYVIGVNFTGDDTFNADFKNATVSVKGFETPLIVSYSTPVVINENVTVTVIMDGNLTDSVTVTINNVSSVKDVSAGKLQFSITATAGQKNITVSFNGNDKYYAAQNSTSFTVDKLGIDLGISSDSITYGEVLVVNVTSNVKFTGNLTVNAGELSKTVHVIDGVGNASFTGLAAGEYVVTSVFGGDDTFNGETANCTVTVAKADSSIELVVFNDLIYVGDDVNVSAIVPRDATGNVTFTLINEKTANVGDNATFTGLGAGNYTIYAVYNGDGNYKESKVVNTTVRVVKDEIDLSIAADDIAYAESLIVNVTANDRFTGDVLVKIGEFNQTAHIIDGMGTAAFANLTAGDYVVTAMFGEDDAFYGGTANCTATVAKADSVIEIVVLNDVIRLGETINVTAIVPAGATGNVTFRFTTNKTVRVGETATFDGLGEGAYVIYAVYGGDSNYKPSKEVNATINVVKYDVNLNVIADDVAYGDDLVVRLTTNETFTGNITVCLGSLSENVRIINGEGNVTFTNLAKGEYLITAEFAETEVFGSDVKNTTSKVIGVNSQLIIVHSDAVIHNNVTVTVSMDAGLNDNVTVNVNGVGVSRAVINGSLSFVIEDISYGVQNITVRFNGNDKYYPVENSTTFFVDYLDANISLSADSVSYGENLVVKITADDKFTGNVTVTVGVLSETVNVINGAGKVSFAGMARGEYVIGANFTGDGTFKADFKNTTSEVIGVNSPLVIVHSDAVIHKNVTITVSMDAGLNDNVTVNVNGVGVSRAVINGSLSFVIPEVPYGVQNITVSFDGNDKYYPVENTTSFFVDYLDADLAISAEEVTYGEDLIVAVSGEFSGEVTVSIGNVTQAVHVSGGKGNATFTGLLAGEYFITASFAGDDTFAAATANTTGVIKGIVVPANQTMSIDVAQNSRSPTFSFSLENATGSFTVSVDGKDVATKELVNGSASITVADLSAGSHNITLKYSGDGKYALIVQSTVLKLNKTATSISASSISKAYGVSKELTMTLKDANGNALSKKTVKIVLNGVTYTENTDGDGKVSLEVSKKLAVKTYTAKITFNGDSNYLKSTKSVKVIVNKAKSKIVAKRKTYKVNAKSKKYTVTLKSGTSPIKKATLYLKIKGKTFKATTNSKGKATFNIKFGTTGKYTAFFNFKGNKYYKASTKRLRIVFLK